jgi:hypothetical protein
MTALSRTAFPSVPSPPDTTEATRVLRPLCPPAARIAQGSIVRERPFHTSSATRGADRGRFFRGMRRRRTRCESRQQHAVPRGAACNDARHTPARVRDAKTRRGRGGRARHLLKGEARIPTPASRAQPHGVRRLPSSDACRFEGEPSDSRFDDRRPKPAQKRPVCRYFGVSDPSY